MNALGLRFWKLAYRKEPISSFIVIVGAVDAVMGGVGERWSLLTFGLMMVMLAVGIRWWQSQRRQTELVEQRVTPYYLPSSPSRPPLPMLSTSKHHPHR